MEFNYQDDRILDDEHTIAELPEEEYIERIKELEAPYRPHPSEIK